MKVVEEFEKAVREHEMKGAQHPHDHEAIELGYQLAKLKLIEALKKLKQK